MKKKLFFNLVLVVMLLAAPFVAFAANTGINSDVFKPTILAGPILICTGASGSGTINQTCNNLCDLVAQIANIIYYAIAVVLWIIAPIMIAVGGIMIMLEGAVPHSVETAKKMITGAIWGIVIVLCAYLIVYTFLLAFGGSNGFIKYVGGFGQSACSVS